MAEPQHQALSDLLDGALDADQAEAAIDALLRDQTLADEWHRLHQLRGLLRAEVDAPFDIGAAVRSAIADEPAYLLPGLAPARQAPRWQRYAVGGALAASVALATVVSLRPWQSAAQAPQIAATPAESAARVSVASSSASQDPSAPQPDRLERYWAVHANSALLAGPDALSPLVHNVRLDDRQ